MVLVKFVCTQCGQDEGVSTDANAWWDMATQRWAAESSETGNFYCSECGDVDVEEVPLTLKDHIWRNNWIAKQAQGSFADWAAEREGSVS